MSCGKRSEREKGRTDELEGHGDEHVPGKAKEVTDGKTIDADVVRP